MHGYCVATQVLFKMAHEMGQYSDPPCAIHIIQQAVHPTERAMTPTVFALPACLVLLSMLGLMQLFLSHDQATPLIVPLLLAITVLTLLHGIYLEWRAGKRRPSATVSRLPGWAMPLIGVIGGLAVCAQLALYLSNSLQDDPVLWFMHVPGITILLGLAAMLHAGWRY